MSQPQNPNVPYQAPPAPGQQMAPGTWSQPPAQASGGAPAIRTQSAWGVWWLCVVTFGIYYFVWYQRINRELCGVLRTPVPTDGKWWVLLIPIYNIVALAKTAQRVNAAHASVGSPTRVNVFVACLLAPAWFASQTRYLQRRVNRLHDVLAGAPR